MRAIPVLLVVLAWSSAVPSASAQPPAEPKIWTVAASAGLALTSGNTDTSTFNAGYDIVYDPRTRNIVKSDGLLIRGTTGNELSASRLSLNIRDEYRIGGRAFVFGQNQYLRDVFKEIDYLIAPTVGVGYKLLDTKASKLSVDGAIGGVWEKNSGREARASGAVTAAEKFARELTATAALTQSFTGLWKTSDVGDSLYTFAIGLAVSMSTRTQLKVELHDTYKNKPPDPEVKKNDVAVLMAIVYKM